MIGKIIRDLKILSQIGEGGMGIVYLGEHVRLKKRYAVKCLASHLSADKQFLERFEKEAIAQAHLEHPNIVQVTDFFEEGDQYFLVMAYVDGHSLEQIIVQKRRLSEPETLRIFKDILNGLNFAHSKGVVHRDMKPSNILVDNKGSAKIMDFGIAMVAGVERKTKTGITMGTAHYMSPEQIMTPKELDHRSDVYSAGVILYEMLTGKVPFDGDTDFMIYQQHVQGKLPDLREMLAVSDTLCAIVEKALEKNRDDRFSGCGEMLEYIEAYERGEHTMEAIIKATVDAAEIPKTQSVSEHEQLVFSGLAASDTETKLMWAICASIAGETMNWDNAHEYIMQLNTESYGGFGNWRLPSKNELDTLSDYAKSCGVMLYLGQFFNKIGFNNVQPGYYWTSTIYASFAEFALIFDMYDGKVGSLHKSGNGYVWPVRSSE